MSRLEKEDGVRCPVCDADLTRDGAIVEVSMTTLRSHIERDEFGNMEFVLGGDREGTNSQENSKTLHTCTGCGNLIELG